MPISKHDNLFPKAICADFIKVIAEELNNLGDKTKGWLYSILFPKLDTGFVDSDPFSNLLLNESQVQPPLF